MHLINKLLYFTYTAIWVIQTSCLLKQIWLHTLNSVPCSLLSLGHDSIMCLWLIFVETCATQWSRRNLHFTVLCSPPQYTAIWRVLSCASEIGVERMWKRVCSSTHLAQLCMFLTTKLFQEKWEKVSNIRMWNAHTEQVDEEVSHLLPQKHEIKLQF